MLEAVDYDESDCSDSFLVLYSSLAAREKTSSTLKPVSAEVSKNLSILFALQ